MKNLNKFNKKKQFKFSSIIKILINIFNDIIL